MECFTRNTCNETARLFYVGLPAVFTWKDLIKALDTYGVLFVKLTVDSTVLPEYASGWVDFATIEGAMQAMRETGGSVLDARLFWPLDDSHQFDYVSNKLFIKGKFTTDVDLKHRFSAYGVVINARIMRDKETRAIRNLAIVEFSNVNEATIALINERNQWSSESESIDVQFYRERVPFNNQNHVLRPQPLMAIANKYQLSYPRLTTYFQEESDISPTSSVTFGNLENTVSDTLSLPSTSQLDHNKPVVCLTPNKSTPEYDNNDSPMSRKSMDTAMVSSNNSFKNVGPLKSSNHVGSPKPSKSCNSGAHLKPCNGTISKSLTAWTSGCHGCGKLLTTKADFKLICGHLNCKKCLTKSICEAYMNFSLDKLVCTHPNCYEKLQSKFIEDLLTPQKLLSYTNTLLNMNLSLPTYSIFCPGCSHSLQLDSLGDNITTCIVCKIHVCECCIGYSFKLIEACKERSGAKEERKPLFHR